MAENSHIEWTDHTFNPWRGCTKVSPGCANCYAEKLVTQRLKGEWGPGKPRQLASDAMWREPFKWNRAEATMMVSHADFVRNARPRVFCASLADWLDGEVPTAWRVRLLNLIEVTPHLDWLLLTKRPASWNARMHEAMGQGSKLALHWLNGEAPANVWLGTSVEDQRRADERIPELLKIPAVVRFLSCEPLLGPVDFVKSVGRLSSFEIPKGGNRGWLGLHWVICGGESGPNARPMHPDWARSLRDQCAVAGVPFFFKQWGEWVFRPTWGDSTGGPKHTFDDGLWVERVGKKAAGRLLDGREHNTIPEGSR